MLGLEVNSRARADGHDVIQHVTQLMTYPKGLRIDIGIGICIFMQTESNVNIIKQFK